MLVSPIKRSHKERVNALLVVATLIAGIAFQAMLNPPGGFWQDDSKVDSGTDPVKFAYYLNHMFGNYVSGRLGFYIRENQLRNYSTSNTTGPKGYSKTQDNVYNFFPYLIRYAGFPILAYKYPGIYVTYMFTNTVAFSSSLTAVFAVIFGFVHDKSVAQNRILVMLMGISIGCISYSYLVVLQCLVTDFYIRNLANFSVNAYIALCCICGIGILLWNMISRMVKLHKKHLTVFYYLKALFSMDASAAGKLVLLIFGICFLIRRVQVESNEVELNQDSY